MEGQAVTTILDAETYQNLKMLADNSNFTESELVAEAVRIFLEAEVMQIEAIKEGIRQADEEKFASENQVKKMFSKWDIDV